MRTVFAIVLLFWFLSFGTKEASTVNQLPEETLESVDIALSQNGTVSITPRLGNAGCKHGIIRLYNPKIRWPDGQSTDQILFEDYGKQSGETITIGPYPTGTRLEFEIRPQTFVCGKSNHSIYPATGITPELHEASIRDRRFHQIFTFILGILTVFVFTKIFGVNLTVTGIC